MNKYSKGKFLNIQDLFDLLPSSIDHEGIIYGLEMYVTSSSSNDGILNIYNLMYADKGDKLLGISGRYLSEVLVTTYNELKYKGLIDNG